MKPTKSRLNQPAGELGAWLRHLRGKSQIELSLPEKMLALI
jgi:hypothetical protein